MKTQKCEETTFVSAEEILADFRCLRAQYPRRRMALVIPQAGHVPCPKCSRNVHAVDTFRKKVKKWVFKKAVHIYIHVDNTACWMRKNELLPSPN